MAAHGFSGRQYDRPGSWQRQCQKRGGDYGDDIRLVRLCAVDNRDDWVAGYDSEHQFTGSING